jgi:hypothetical protein
VYISTTGDAPETSGIRQTQTAGGKIDTVHTVSTTCPHLTVGEPGRGAAY